jgi:hypothetical protein
MDHYLDGLDFEYIDESNSCSSSFYDSEDVSSPGSDSSFSSQLNSDELDSRSDSMTEYEEFCFGVEDYSDSFDRDTTSMPLSSINEFAANSKGDVLQYLEMVSMIGKPNELFLIDELETMMNSNQLVLTEDADLFSRCLERLELLGCIQLACYLIRKHTLQSPDVEVFNFLMSKSLFKCMAHWIECTEFIIRDIPLNKFIDIMDIVLTRFKETNHNNELRALDILVKGYFTNDCISEQRLKNFVNLSAIMSYILVNYGEWCFSVVWNLNPNADQWAFKTRFVEAIILQIFVFMHEDSLTDFVYWVKYRPYSTIPPSFVALHHWIKNVLRWKRVSDVTYADVNMFYIILANRLSHQCNKRIVKYFVEMIYDNKMFLMK